MASTPQSSAARPWFGLVMLTLVYILNFLDRQILSILAVPIKAEFHLSDAQMGWLGGLAFGLFYSILAIPAARLADRALRVGVMAAALALWSGFTALCGLTGGFISLFIARLGVGVGEAGGVAPAYSLISDYFPPRMRARAMALYSLGIPIGIAAGAFIGGLLASDWRRAFIWVGLAGLVVTAPFLLLVKEPARQKPASAMPSLAGVAADAFSRPSFWLISIGAGSASLVGYGLMFWLPAYLVRSAGFDLLHASRFIAGVTLIGGVAGMLLGGALADRLGGARKGAYALIPAIAFVLSAGFYVLAVMVKAPSYAFWLFVIPQALGLMWFGPLLTSVQHLGPPAARSQVSALFLLILNLIGLGLGPYAFGKLSDLLTPAFGTEALKYAFLAGLGFYILAAILLTIAAGRLARDWAKDGSD